MTQINWSAALLNDADRLLLHCHMTQTVLLHCNMTQINCSAIYCEEVSSVYCILPIVYKDLLTDEPYSLPRPGPSPIVTNPAIIPDSPPHSPLSHSPLPGLPLWPLATQPHTLTLSQTARPQTVRSPDVNPHPQSGAGTPRDQPTPT